MDIGASVIAKLKNKSIETGKPFQLHLQRSGMTVLFLWEK